MDMNCLPYAVSFPDCYLHMSNVLASDDLHTNDNKTNRQGEARLQGKQNPNQGTEIPADRLSTGDCTVYKLSLKNCDEFLLPGILAH